MAEKCIILMSTYNGEKYLQEQLDSILKQKDVDIHLLIRDDGSEDRTRSILKDYAAKYSNVSLLLEDNIGCKQSFMRLGRVANEMFPDARYFSFADQDDVWKENKLSAAIMHLFSGMDKPMLYFCRYQLVNAELQPMKTEFVCQKLTLTGALVLFHVPGCSMTFNRKLLELFIMADENMISLHDSWIFRTCLACGGVVICDDSRNLLYRQHGDNIIGDAGMVTKWKRRFRQFVSHRNKISNQAKLLLDTYGDFLSGSDRINLKYLAEYRRKMLYRLKLVLTARFTAHSMTHNVLFRVAAITGRL